MWLFVPPLNSALSRLVLGTMVLMPVNPTLAHELLYVCGELGGNAIDTAHLYNGGESERALGSGSVVSVTSFARSRTRIVSSTA